jgi:hypothetical protein
MHRREATSSIFATAICGEWKWCVKGDFLAGGEGMSVDKVRGTLSTMMIVVPYFEVLNCVGSTDTEAGARQDDGSGGEAHHYHR